MQAKVGAAAKGCPVDGSGRGQHGTKEKQNTTSPSIVLLRFEDGAQIAIGDGREIVHNLCPATGGYSCAPVRVYMFVYIRAQADYPVVQVEVE